MPLPAGVSTRTIRVPVPLDAFGNPPKSFKGTVTPDRVLVWSATGDRLWPTGAQLPAVASGRIEFAVPRVDQAGWVDANGNAVTGWTYRITIRATWPGSKRTVTRRFQVKSSTPNPVELDVLPDGATIPLNLADPYVKQVDLAAALAGIDTSDDGWTYEHLTADYTNNTAGMTDVFAGFTPEANGRYQVEVFGAVNSAGATIAFVSQLAGPATGVSFVSSKITTTQSAGVDHQAHGTAFGQASNITSTPTAPSPYALSALVAFGATPGAGNVRMQARSETAGTVVTMKAGSYMRWRKLP